MTVELVDGVGTLTLDRPDCRNAVDAATVQALRVCLDELTDDRSCRVVVLRGQGETFCSGWDLRQLDVLRDLPGRALEHVFEDAHGLLDALREAPQATICAVQGAALGFGLSLVAACDLAIASRNAAFGLPEVRAGLVPSFAMVDLAPMMPAKHALDWLLTGDLHDAGEAFAAGLVSRLADGDPAEAAARIAADLARRSAAQITETKERFGKAAHGITDQLVLSAIRASATQINEGGLSAGR